MNIRTMNDGITGITSNDNGVTLNREAALVLASRLNEYADLIEENAVLAFEGDNVFESDDVTKAEIIGLIARRITA